MEAIMEAMMEAMLKTINTGSGHHISTDLIQISCILRTYKFNKGTVLLWKMDKSRWNDLIRQTMNKHHTETK